MVLAPILAAPPPSPSPSPSPPPPLELPIPAPAPAPEVEVATPAPAPGPEPELAPVVAPLPAPAKANATDSSTGNEQPPNAAFTSSRVSCAEDSGSVFSSKSRSSCLAGTALKTRRKPLTQSSQSAACKRGSFT